MYRQDWEITVFTILVTLLATFLVAQMDRTAATRQDLTRLLASGLALLIFAALGNAIQQRRGGGDFFVAFLTIKRTGGWPFRALLPLAYVLAIPSAAYLITDLLKTRDEKRSP